MSLVLRVLLIIFASWPMIVMLLLIGSESTMRCGQLLLFSMTTLLNFFYFLFGVIIFFNSLNRFILFSSRIINILLYLRHILYILFFSRLININTLLYIYHLIFGHYFILDLLLLYWRNFGLLCLQRIRLQWLLLLLWFHQLLTSFILLVFYFKLFQFFLFL